MSESITSILAELVVFVTFGLPVCDSAVRSAVFTLDLLGDHLVLLHCYWVITGMNTPKYGETLRDT